jgi:Malectin domain
MLDQSASSKVLLLLLLLLQSSVMRVATAARTSVVTSFELWDAATKEKIVTLVDGVTIPMQAGGFNVKAVVEQRIGSIAYAHNGQPVHVENYKPFFFCADLLGQPFRCNTLVEGEHTIKVTPYAFQYALGPAATANSISFTIVPTTGLTSDTDLGRVVVPPAAPTTPPGTVIVPPRNTSQPVAPPVTISPVAVANRPTATASTTATTTTTTTSTSSTGDFATIRINCGGPAHTDAEGNIWMADKYYVEENGVEGGAFALEAAILGTTEEELFQSERWGMFKYEIPVPPGDYQVILQ